MAYESFPSSKGFDFVKESLNCFTDGFVNSSLSLIKLYSFASVSLN